MTTPAAGEIYDLGYRHYSGPRLGRRGALWFLYIDGLRALFGIGRGPQARRAPILLTVCMVIPAVIQVGVLGLAGPFGQMMQLFTHADYFATTLWVFALFCALQVPQLVTHDVQHRVLALYFSRAVRPRDYIVARLAAIVTGIGLVALSPHLVLMLGRAFTEPVFWPALVASFRPLPSVALSVALVALLLGSVALAVAALVGRRALATTGILALWLLTHLFVSMVAGRQNEQLRPLVFVSPLTVAHGISTWVLAPEEFVPVEPSAQLGVPEGLPTAPVPPPVATTADSSIGQAPATTEASRRMRRRQTFWVRVGWPGWVYLAGASVLFLGCLITLDVRIRRVEI